MSRNEIKLILESPLPPPFLQLLNQTPRGPPFVEEKMIGAINRLTHSTQKNGTWNKKVSTPILLRCLHRQTGMQFDIQNPCSQILWGDNFFCLSTAYQLVIQTLSTNHSDIQILILDNNRAKKNNQIVAPSGEEPKPYRGNTSICMTESDQRPTFGNLSE